MCFVKRSGPQLRQEKVRRPQNLSLLNDLEPPPLSLLLARFNQSFASLRRTNCDAKNEVSHVNQLFESKERKEQTASSESSHADQGRRINWSKLKLEGHLVVYICQS